MISGVLQRSPGFHKTKPEKPQLTLPGLGSFPALCGKEGNPMSPVLKLTWILSSVSLSLNCWAFEEGSPSNREQVWQKFMEQGKQHRAQRRLVEAEMHYLAAVTAAQQFGAEDTRLAASLNALATAYHEQGRYADAGLNYRKALANLGSCSRARE